MSLSVLSLSVHVCRLSRSFGYLNKDGFCSGATCHKFPVVVGEFNVLMSSPVSISSPPLLPFPFSSSTSSLQHVNQFLQGGCATSIVV